MPIEITTTQKIVLIPKFHPTTNPATSNNIALIANTIVPIWIEMPICSSALHSTSERPAAPPPVPLTGRIQPIQANEYSIMPNVMRKYSLTVFSTESIVMGFMTRG